MPRPAWVFLALSVAGCGSPSAANIDLRKKVQALEGQVSTLNQRHDRDVQTLASQQAARPTVPSLPADRLAELFTTHGLEFDNVTGGDNPDPTAKVDTELKVAVHPVDQEGTAIKAAGAIAVRAYDLDDPAHPLVGSWDFSARQSGKNFYSRFGLYGYVLTCPFGTQPVHPNLTVKVTFVDGLTGLTFATQQQVAVRLGK